MRNFTAALLAGAAIALSFATLAQAKDKIIGVSWSNFQEERWKTDEAAIKEVVEAAGDKYISTDAQGSAQKQAADIEGLIAQNVDVILVVAFDSDAILPSIQKISEAGMKAIGTGLSRGVTWRDVEVVRHGGPPQLQFHREAAKFMAALGATRALLSLTHTADLAIAHVILVAD